MGRVRVEIPIRIGENGEVWWSYAIGPQCVAVREGHTATRMFFAKDTDDRRSGPPLGQREYLAIECSDG